MYQRDLTTDEINRYHEDGVVLVKNAVDPLWVDRLKAFGEAQLNNPSQLCNDGNPGKESGRMFTDRYLWRTNRTVYDFISQAGCARLAAQAMGSESSRFYFDHLLHIRCPIESDHENLSYMKLSLDFGGDGQLSLSLIPTQAAR